jgi:riboflavin synthase
VKLEIEAGELLEDVSVGDSISTNGVCLTVTSLKGDSFTADVMHQTMRLSNLGVLKQGDRVNLERALTLQSRLGGHLVAGHVDGVGRITALERDDTAVWITVATPPEIARYVVDKGSIAVDGVSLTVAYAACGSFKVSVIPHTQEATTLTSKRIGDVVNLENDMIVRYVEKLMKGDERKGMSLEFLLENGF